MLCGDSLNDETDMPFFHEDIPRTGFPWGMNVLETFATGWVCTQPCIEADGSDPTNFVIEISLRISTCFSKTSFYQSSQGVLYES